MEEEELFVSEGVGESDGEAEGDGDLEEAEPVGEWLRPSQRWIPSMWLLKSKGIPTERSAVRSISVMS